MRSTDPDPLSNPVPWRPLGEKVEPTKPKAPDWQPVAGNPQIERGPDGKLRTSIPLPK